MENTIYHYGIKGMRWGVRRTPEQLGRKRSSVSEMSDQELQQIINRKLKEKQYKDLMKSPYVKVGEKIVNGIVIAAGTELAKEFVKKNLRKGLETVLNNIGNS